MYRRGTRPCRSSSRTPVLVEVGNVSDLVHGVPVVVRVNEREVVLIRWGDDVYALHGICPHMQRSFGLGAVRGRAGGRPGEYYFDPADPVLTCPWHQFEFRLADGQCLVDRKLRIRRFDVTLREGKVLVELASRRTRTKAKL